MVMMFGSAGAMMAERDPGWIRDMVTFLRSFDRELREAGELVDAQGLADPDRAEVVRRTDTGIVVTDGPYAESKEGLVGYWVLDVADRERLLDLAGRVVQWSGAVELRPVLDGPPEV
ncbi:YciI family protein [Nakamurella endophytica]|nr:YciI family protein [Nakamurella endophytica]